MQVWFASRFYWETVSIDRKFYKQLGYIWFGKVWWVRIWIWIQGKGETLKHSSMKKKRSKSELQVCAMQVAWMFMYNCEWMPLWLTNYRKYFKMVQNNYIYPANWLWMADLNSFLGIQKNITNGWNNSFLGTKYDYKWLIHLSAFLRNTTQKCRVNSANLSSSFVISLETKS